MSSLYRSGYLIPENWETIINKLTEYDDVILGLDTNILYNSFITEGLLPMLTFVKPREYVHIPNWLLIVIPAAVLNELEEASNIKDIHGNISFQSRMGYRALQEIMELSQNIDISGLSVMITGESDPALLLNDNIKQLRMELSRMFTKLHPELKDFTGYVKNSSGDITIRTQFKKFLQAIDFHKGTFFLTADKTCAALAMAEGLNAIYVKYNHIPETNELTPISFYDTLNSESISLNVPVGTIIYDLVVTFGIIGIKLGSRNILLKIDYKGERLDRWVHKQIKIKKHNLEFLLNNYKGRLHLERAFSLLKKLTDRFEIIRWGTGFDGAFDEQN